MSSHVPAAASNSVRLVLPPSAHFPCFELQPQSSMQFATHVMLAHGSFELLSVVTIPALSVVVPPVAGHKWAFISSSFSFVVPPKRHIIFEVDQPHSSEQRRAHGIAKHRSSGSDVTCTAVSVLAVAVLVVIVEVVVVVVVVAVVAVVVVVVAPAPRSSAAAMSTSHQNRFAR